MTDYVYRVEMPPEGTYVRVGNWFIIPANAIVSRSSTDGKSYETAELGILWENANELIERELDETTEFQIPPIDATE